MLTLIVRPNVNFSSIISADDDADDDAEINDITRNEASSPRNPCNNQLLIHVSCTQQSDSHVQLTCSTCMVSPAVLVGYEPL